MKKLAVFVLIIALVAIAVGCGKKSGENSSSAEVSIEPSVMQSAEVSSKTESSTASSAVVKKPVESPPKPGSIINVRKTTSELSERYKTAEFNEYDAKSQKQYKIGDNILYNEDEAVYLYDSKAKEKKLILGKGYSVIAVLSNTHFVFWDDEQFNNIFDLSNMQEHKIAYNGKPLRYCSFSNGKAYFEYSSSFDNPTKFDEFDMYGVEPTHNVYFEVDISSYNIKEKSYDLKINRDGNSVAIRFSPNRKYASMLRVVGTEQTYNNPRNPTIVMLTIFELDTAKVISTKELTFNINSLPQDGALNCATFISNTSLCVVYGYIEGGETPVYEIDIA